MGAPSSVCGKCISSRWICEIRYGFAVTNFYFKIVCSSFSSLPNELMELCKLDVLACMCAVSEQESESVSLESHSVRSLHVFIGG